MIAVFVVFPPALTAPSLVVILAISVVPGGIIVVAIVVSEVFGFASVAPCVKTMVAIPIAVAISEGGFAKRDAEIGGRHCRGGYNDRRSRQGQGDERPFDDVSHAITPFALLPDYRDD